jgi:hypothetical protein
MPGGRFGFVMPVVGESVDVALKKLRRKVCEPKKNNLPPWFVFVPHEVLMILEF